MKSGDDPSRGIPSKSRHSSNPVAGDDFASDVDPPSAPHVVGVGASAGGLKALKALFSRVPPDSGLAYVVIMHLSPDHISHLADVLQPHSKLPVEQVTGTVPLAPNRIYVIPPGRNLSAIDTHLRLSDFDGRRGERAPIDHFLRTLSETHGRRGIGVILSGSGSDGAIGLKRIKERGGLTIVQDPKEAEFDGMPQSAIATGMVDVVLPLAKIPEQILKFVRTQPRVPPDEKGMIEKGQRRPLQEVFAHIRTQTDRDFSRYKQSTLLRRIGRRMQLHHIEDLDRYLKMLQNDPCEVTALADDFLINVTEFFRDEGAFELLEKKVIPGLFKNKGRGDVVRVWSVGCATGEEAYSLAILLLEEAARRQTPPDIQIFASDLHDPSLQCGREGYFPETIETSVSPERLKKFFVSENGRYRVRREVRSLIVFAAHDLLSDPPFSRIDLIACRNLLIYLQRDVQRDVIELLHYALNPGGHLLLGQSETIDRAGLFRLLDKKHCLYVKRDVPSRALQLSSFPAAVAKPGSRRSLPARPPEAESYASIHQKFLEKVGPPSLLLNPDDNVVHLSANAGRYLRQPDGSITNNLFKLVREELRIELRSAVHTVRQTNVSAVSKPISIKDGDGTSEVVLSVRPSPDPEGDNFLLLIFDEHTPLQRKSRTDATADDITASEFQAELDLTRQRLQTIIEEYETSQEEMQAANEELQSSNEELRSTLEELETSREELESMNEELATISHENRQRVEELTQLSNDLQNLLSATNIATIFLDRNFRILRFTPTVGELFKIRAADRGRPLSDLTNRLGYDEINRDAHEVLERLTPIEREVASETGRWYLTRTIPYRNAEGDRIEGLAITFVDITERTKAEEALRESEERYRALVTATSDVVYRMSPDWTEMRTLDGRNFIVDTKIPSKTWLDLYILPEDQPYVMNAIKEAIRTKNTFELEHRVRRADGSVGWTSSRAIPLMNEQGQIVEWFGAASDVTARKRAEEALETEKAYAESIVETLHEPLLVLTPDLKVRSTNQAFYDHFRVRLEETEGKLIYELGNGQWNIPELRTLLEDVLPDSNVFNDYEVSHHFGKIGQRVMLVNARRLDHVQLILLGIRDITERKEAEAALQKSERKQRELSHSLEQRVFELGQQTEHLRYVAAELSSTEQRERKRLAALLHDDLQQLLMAARMQLSQAASRLGAGPPSDDLKKAENWISDAIAAARDLSRQLRPPALYEDGLGAALKWLASEMNKRHGLEVKLEFDDIPKNLNDMARAFLFDCAREFLINVIKHAGVQEATLELRRDETRIRLLVRDCGVGFSLDESVKILRNGGGIGLFGVRERVAAMGGAMTIESAPGQGTTIELTMPLDSAIAAEPAPAQLQLQPTRPKSKTRSALTTDARIRVLLVDDHALVRQGVANILKADPRTVVFGECGDGIEAIESIEREQPDIVLMDINMPRMNGIEATREIHRRWPDLPIIGLSVQDDDASSGAMRDAGAIAFISKVEEAERLIGAILQIHSSLSPTLPSPE